MIAAIYARSTQQTATEKQKCIARIAQRHDFRGLIAAAALVSLTACATSQAPSAPVPLAKPEVQPADTIRFLTSEYDGRFTVTRLAGFVDLPTTELGEQIRKLLGDFGQSLQRVPDGIGPYALDEIQMGLAVDAKAGVVVSAGATASITLTFRRAKGPSEPARTR